jgi:hypothetical protein
MDDSGSNVTGESGLELSDFLLHLTCPRMLYHTQS